MSVEHAMLFQRFLLDFDNKFDDFESEAQQLQHTIFINQSKEER